MHVPFARVDTVQTSGVCTGATKHQPFPVRPPCNGPFYHEKAGDIVRQKHDDLDCKTVQWWRKRVWVGRAGVLLRVMSMA